MPRSYPPEFRRKVLDLVEAGRPINQVAELLGVSDQTIYNWRRRHLIAPARRRASPAARTPSSSLHGGASPNWRRSLPSTGARRSCSTP
jgi:transposase-like protein